MRDSGALEKSKEKERSGRTAFEGLRASLSLCDGIKAAGAAEKSC